MVEIVGPKGADNGLVLDPEEGLAPDGTIRTGARRDRVPAEFEPVLASAVAAFGEVSDNHSELHLYGSVATGMARLGVSDVDLLAIGVPTGWARDVSADLSHRFMALCRGVEIGQAEMADFRGEGSAAYGGRVFLHHYCVPIAGPNAVRSVRPFLGDAQAARKFNGDIAECLNRWRSGADPRRVARKTLLAAAGFVSVHYGTWTTDRSTAARRWALPGGRQTHGRGLGVDDHRPASEVKLPEVCRRNDNIHRVHHTILAHVA